jgi:hypothetical protein
MNTPADKASAAVFRRVLARTLWRGQKASQPFLARRGLTESFIAPAIAALNQIGVTIRLNHPLRAMMRSDQRVMSLVFDDVTVDLSQDDKVVLATPWAVARSLLPELPNLPSSSIVNAHFRLGEAPPPIDGGFLGLLDGTAQWLFVRDDIISVTVSGASSVVDLDADILTEMLWRDVKRALNINALPLASRIIKEKRATLFHTPEIEAQRPKAQQGDNLILAGDWTATGLPCTLEGALTSGAIAAALVSGQNP